MDKPVQIVPDTIQFIRPCIVSHLASGMDIGFLKLSDKHKNSIACMANMQATSLKKLLF